LILVISCVGISCSTNINDKLAGCNVVWNSQSEDSWGSMPVGNGDIGANVWVTPDGCLQFYISKTDAWSENGRLLKVGKLKVSFSPNILSSGKFRQELDLESGMIKIDAGEGDKTLSLNFWIDANNPTIYIEGKSAVPVKVSARYDGWRRGKRELKGVEVRSAYGIMSGEKPIIVEPDTVLSGKNSLIWCHHNQRSIWEETLRVQALDELINKENDPLLNLTFGALVQADGWVNNSQEELIMPDAARDFKMSVCALTEKSETVDKWKASVSSLANGIEQIPFAERKEKHLEWWKKFWDGSYIFVSSPVDSRKVSDMSRAYQLQRYMNACAGRGNMPIKFNGSVFTVDMLRPVKKNMEEYYDADFRDWGPCYWWQNTRLPYWSMLYSGDFEMMKPLFKMYTNALPLAKYRTGKYYGHEGAYFPETIYFWGTWNNDNYGWDRPDMPDGLSQNMYIRYLWEGGIELTAMMLDYYDFTSDNVFLKETLLPFASEIIDFYRSHYKKGKDGKIIFEPAQALETYWEGTVNPMPEVAGLNFVLNRFVSFPKELTKASFKEKCKELLTELPALPVGQKDGKEVLLPGEKLGPKGNIENPELYAVFPYRLFGVGKPSPELAVNTFDMRINKDYRGWQQDAIQAAMVGKTEEAAKMVMDNFNTKHEGSRFPAFWGPNYDWIPDQDHGSVNMRALQNMLIQTDGDKIFLFPAWPADWNVDFKVHAPGNTTVDGRFRNGKIENLNVSPESRRKDITHW
jgi:alpha-L-fucosidase 2